jgi:hypothetical protein
VPNVQVTNATGVTRAWPALLDVPTVGGAPATETLLARTRSSLRLPATDRRYLTHGQVADLADAAGRYRLLVLVLAYCALRWGEAVALRVRREVPVRPSQVLDEPLISGLAVAPRGFEPRHRFRNLCRGSVAVRGYWWTVRLTCGYAACRWWFLVVRSGRPADRLRTADQTTASRSSSLASR